MNSAAKATTSQKIWLGKLSVLKGGKPALCCASVPVCVTAGSLIN
jgi:hypothetical protein